MTLLDYKKSNYALMGAAVSAALIVFGCAQKPAPVEQGLVVARAFDHTLHLSDLQLLLPKEVSAGDSAAMIQGYINNWIRQQVVIHSAEQNLSDEAKDVRHQLEDYRNSLIIHAYEQQLVQQKLNTTVHDTVMQRYLDEHEADLQLKSNVLRAEWFKVKEANDPKWKKLQKWYSSEDEEDWQKLELWLAENHITVMGNEGTWIPVDELAEIGGLSDTQLGRVVKKLGRHTIEVADGRVFLRIFEHREKGATAPLSFVNGRITSIIVNQRRVRLLEEMRTALFNEALNNKHVEIY